MRPKILVSYFAVRELKLSVQDFAVNFAKGWDQFIDSGAFSAGRMPGGQIPIGDYTAFAKDVAPYVGRIATLDVIGDAAGSERNTWRLMETDAIRPRLMPVFHMGSPPAALDVAFKQAHACAGRIAIGRMVPIAGNPALMHSGCTFVHRRASEEGIKLHAFGVTNPEVLLRYPWESADSTNWLGARRFGRISALSGGKWRTFIASTLAARHPLIVARLGLSSNHMTAAALRRSYHPGIYLQLRALLECERLALAKWGVGYGKIFQAAGEMVLRDEDHVSVFEAAYSGTIPSFAPRKKNIRKAIV